MTDIANEWSKLWFVCLADNAHIYNNLLIAKTIPTYQIVKCLSKPNLISMSCSLVNYHQVIAILSDQQNIGQINNSVEILWFFLTKLSSDPIVVDVEQF